MMQFCGKVFAEWLKSLAFHGAIISVSVTLASDSTCIEEDIAVYHLHLDDFKWEDVESSLVTVCSATLLDDFPSTYTLSLFIIVRLVNRSTFWLLKTKPV